MPQDPPKLTACPGCGATCGNLTWATPAFTHDPICRYADYPNRAHLEFRLRNQRKEIAERAAQDATPISKLQELEVAGPHELDSFKPGPIEGTLWCDYCGSLIADLEKHLEWHASLSAAPHTAPMLSPASSEIAYRIE